MWLHIPLAVDPASDGRWVLEINHPDLNRIDVLLLQGGKVLQRSVLGTEVPRAQRAPARAHARAGVSTGSRPELRILAAGADPGRVILPITFNTPTGILGRRRERANAPRCVDRPGAVASSSTAWRSGTACASRCSSSTRSHQRQPARFLCTFLAWASRSVWGHSPWLTSHAVGLASLMAITGSFLFMSQARRGTTRKAALAPHAVGALFTVGLGVAFALDLISLKGLAAIVSIMGPLPALLCLPGAWRRARAGDSIATTLLIAWFVYGLGSAAIIGVINGALPVNFWTLHSFQISATLDMLLFMRVLGLRTKSCTPRCNTPTSSSTPCTRWPHRPVVPACPTAAACRSNCRQPSRATHENLLAV